MKKIVALSASHSRSSKTVMLIDHALGLLEQTGAALSHYKILELEPDELAFGRTGPAAERALAEVESADGVIIASAIYKASFSGLLKICLDVMPQFGLAGKAVLPIGTGGSLAHVLALDYSLRPVLQSMGARHVAQSLFVAEPDLIVSDDKFALSEMSQSGLQEALNNFLHSISGADTGKLLGHPRPPVPCDPAEWAGLLA